MNPYTGLAEFYDELTADVPYDAMAERLWALMCQNGRPPRLALELGCGTGSVSLRLGTRGLELIAIDSAPEMLDQARQKCAGLAVPPLFVCQDMAALDLYGTVQAAFCTLDSLNYLPDQAALRRVFEKVSLFLEPRGLFIFDVKSPAMFAEMAGTASVHARDGLFCAWQYGYEPASRRAVHTVDIFVGRAGRYSRVTELHEQRAFTRMQIEEQLDRARLRPRAVYRGYSSRKASEEAGRLLFVAEKR